ncbi:MAG: hypothetical protein CVU51_10995 [Deltaproteobacteria bacterium HGW-Deltaproteobacteria-1]|jgi:hypothetical protein|nr:MAG: hypothetical protein CVU51_10995 [Deltaproteobacteria bacterium HGW-Deltaproteobacteria-1]
MHDDPTRTTPIGLARYAREFYDAAIIVDEKLCLRHGYELVPSVPVMYLTAHSIELILKAFLLFKGVSLTKLKCKYGHDIEKAFSKANELGLDESVKFDLNEVAVLKTLNVLYSSRQLNYIIKGTKQFPAFAMIRTLAAKMLNTIAPMVGFR